jgi:hypothetical protein
MQTFYLFAGARLQIQKHVDKISYEFGRFRLANQIQEGPRVDDQLGQFLKIEAKKKTNNLTTN